MHIKKTFITLSIILITLLAACSGQTTEEKIHNHLEEAVVQEEDFENLQSEIVDLETQEQEIYNQIIDLSMDEFDKIVELTDQALKIIDKRAEKIESEKESIEASQEAFGNIEDLLNNLETTESKEKAEKIYDVMNQRYETYAALNKAYMKSLDQERELYTMLQDEEIEQETLTEHIDTINTSYEEVLKLNDEFNAFTEEYNGLKKEFYEAAELKVSYEE